MASKTFSGQLDQAMNEAAAEGNKILFIPQQTVGEVLPGAASELTVESDGTYSIKLAYNTYSIYHYSDVTKRKTLLATDIVVSTDTAVTTIPDLLGSVVPVTEDSVLTIQGYLDEANEAKTDAEEAQAATEALFDDFDSSVADSMSLVYTDTPSLSIPFNESGRLDYGVGTEYVSGLPVYGVDFTRSTASTVINKSGVLETLAADEIGIGADGVWLHGAYTNLITYSDDFTGSGWITSAITVTSVSDEIFGKSSSLLAGDGTGSSTSSAYFLATNLDTSEDSYTATFFAKKSNYDNLYCGIYDVTNSSWIIYPDGNPIDLSDGLDHEVELNFTKPSTCTSLRVIVLRMVESLDMDVYVSSVQMTKTKSKVPFISTSGATASATTTICSAPITGNLPVAGESFTVVCDGSFPKTSENSTLYQIGETPAGTGIRANGSSVVLSYETSSGIGTAPWYSNDSEMHRFCATYDADSLIYKLYVDGDEASTVDLDEKIYYEVSQYIYMGSRSEGGAALGSQIKNFKVLPYAASADEVKSWGAPK